MFCPAAVVMAVAIAVKGIVAKLLILLTTPEAEPAANPKPLDNPEMAKKELATTVRCRA